MLVKTKAGERHVLRCAICVEEWVGAVGTPLDAVLDQAKYVGWEVVNRGLPPLDAGARDGTQMRMSVRCPRHALGQKP